MNLKQFQRFISRDEVMVDTGYLDDTAVPQHRIGRGHGGSPHLDMLPSNIIVFSSGRNGLIESRADERQFARRKGWSLERWEDPGKVPFYHFSRGWVMIDDDYEWHYAPPKVVSEWLKDRRYDRG